MTAAPNFYAKARSETAELLNYDLACLTPDQSLRLDCAVALRLALDDLQGRVVRGESIDVTRMLTASEALARLLPPSALATPPPEPRGDPRQVMWEIYKQMRERGELSLKALPPEDHFRELEAENERLKARLAGKTITPPTSDIVPPGERAECDAGPRAGPDDPKPKRPGPVIEGRAVPKPPSERAAPQSSAAPAYDYNAQSDWKNYVLPSGEITLTPFGGGRRWWGPVGS
jgi:hypothetical protein